MPESESIISENTVDFQNFNNNLEYFKHYLSIYLIFCQKLP